MKFTRNENIKRKSKMSENKRWGWEESMSNSYKVEVRMEGEVKGKVRQWNLQGVNFYKKKARWLKIKDENLKNVWDNAFKLEVKMKR
jgi:hypothetical protein